MRTNGIELAALAAGLWTAAAAQAALVVTVQSASVSPGGTVFVDADVTTDGTETQRVDTFVIGLTTPPLTGRGFSGDATRTDDALTGDTRAMLLGNATFESLGVDSAAGNSSAIQGFVLNDPPDADTGVPLAGANGLGLLRIGFTAPANASPGTTFTIGVDEAVTSFATPGDDSSLIAYTSQAGTIAVNAISEPAAGLLFVGVSALRVRRRRIFASIPVSRRLARRVACQPVGDPIEDRLCLCLVKREAGTQNAIAFAI